MKKKKSRISTTVTPVQFVGEELSIKVLSLTPVSKDRSSWKFWEVLANFAGLRSKSKSKGTAIIPEWFELSRKRLPPLSSNRLHLNKSFLITLVSVYSLRSFAGQDDTRVQERMG